MNKLSESMQLLGLVVTTLPFEMVEGNAEATVSINVDLEQLESLKQEFETAVASLEDDAERTEYNDSIYLLTRVIELVTEKLNGNNLQ
jgi:hypothetical protein